MVAQAGIRVVYDAVLFYTATGPDIRLKKNVFATENNGELKKNTVEIKVYEVEKGQMVEVEVAKSTPIESTEVGQFNSIAAALARKHELEAADK